MYYLVFLSCSGLNSRFPTMHKTGYREMLRDRIPEYVDIALLWCNTKGRYIDLIYQNQIKIYVDKQERYRATLSILNVYPIKKEFDFDKSIDWENLSVEDSNTLKYTSRWVTWFKYSIVYIKDVCIKRFLSGTNNEDTISELCSGLLNKVDSKIRKNLARFIVNYFQKKNEYQ